MMLAEHDHKVRGGCALSDALASAGPCGCEGAAAAPPHLRLGKGSPTDSAGSASTLTASQQQPLSDGMSGVEWPPSPQTSQALPSPASSTQQQHQQLAAPPGEQQQQQGRQQQRVLPHSAATAPQAVAAQEHARHRRRLPFLGCFGSSGSSRLLGSSVSSEEEMARWQPVVSASEVGIRPCFYWLEAPISEEDRMFAEANARWLKSDCQDDAVVIEHFGGLVHQTFAGVFDGHGPWGRNAAKFASTRLPQLLAAKAGGSGGSERRRLRAMREAFLEVNAGMRDMGQAGFDASLSGTTACCALLVGRKVLVASTGDSRCVVARRGAGGELEAVPLTWDAKPSLPEEQKRIAQAGGVVKQLLDERGERVGAYRVFSRGDDVLPGLAMSRSLGDLYAQEVGVTPEPIMNTYSLTDRDLFLILATDGLWDIMGNEEAADFVERYRAAREPHVSCAEALTLEAQERWKALHDEAIVDDISCVILHTAGLPPAELDSRVPRPLARAASCNDEANQLYLQWRVERDVNPSNHKPKQYFKHLYDGAEDAGGSSGSDAGNGNGWRSSSGRRALAAADAAAAEAEAAAASPRGNGSGSQQQQEQAEQASPVVPALGDPGLARRISTPPPPPTSPIRLDAPQYAYASASGSLPASSASPRDGGSPRLASLCSPPRGGGLSRMDDISSHSPISSYGDLGSEGTSEPSTRRGTAFASSAFAGAFASGPAWPGADMSAAAGLARRSTGPQPIPRKGSGESSEEGAVTHSLPLDMLLRPVRKAYPSSGNMQQHLPGGLPFSYSHSYRSDGSGLLSGDTPRSGDGGRDGASLEKKVRGGMSRSISVQSTPRLAASGGSTAGLAAGLPSHASLPAAHPSNASLLASSRASFELRSGSAPGSPAGESLLASPHPSPVALSAVALGGGYTRVQVATCRVVHSVAPLEGLASLQQQPGGIGGGLPAPPLLNVRRDLVTKGTQLSRRASDTAGLVHAVTQIEEAAAGASARSCAAAAAAAGAAAGSPVGGPRSQQH